MTTRTAVRTPAAAESPAQPEGLDLEAIRGQRRDRRMQRSRRQIAEAAVRLIEKKGFSATTIEEIAAAADYSTSTFFRLFADKEEVMFYDFPERLGELQAIFANPHGNAWQTIRHAFIDFAQRWDIEADDLGRRRARLFHAEPSLRARYFERNAQWEETIQELLITEFGDDAAERLSASLISGAAIAAFRAAWRVQIADDSLALVDCVRDAFDRLERIGPFFRSAPIASKRAAAARPRRR